MEKHIVFASGGIDSTTLLYELESNNIRDVYPVIINYGQKFFEKEFSVLKDVCPEDYKKSILSIDVRDVYKYSASKLFGPVDLWKEEFHDNYNSVSKRTVLFFTIASILVEDLNCKNVHFGFIDTKNVNSLDCTIEYIYNIRDVFFQGVKLHIPYIHMSKHDVRQKANKLDVPLYKTYSCQINQNIHCGACPNCMDRKKVLKGD